ncbi:putative phosphatidate cytidylyltransferase [Lyophyllum shimeji]|uniref:Phosphatidate cytidylyltransferase n=1 Tax=Lyophyllum shimeji TaxID=47721 RepID=A0A9P3UNM5_LYOSH|nr:putative phosphatidate cytidylyltransferase [Lyophyllum shimeji]
MSRIAVGRPVIASKTTFDALVVDSGEETDEEEVVVVSSAESSAPVEQKPSKSAIRKAQKLARAWKRQQQKALLKEQRTQASVLENLTSSEASLKHDSAVESGREVFDSAAEADTNSIEYKVSSPAFLPPPAQELSQADTTGEPAQLPSSVEESVPPVSLTAQKHVSEEDLPAQKQPIEDQRPVEPPVSLPLHETASSQDAEKVKKRQSFITRTLWTFIMIGGFICLLLLGHAYMILLVMLCQTLVYREVTALFSLKSTKPESYDAEAMRGKDPWSKTLNWYFFAVTNYFLYGESIIYYFKHVVFADAQLLPFATNHRMISFILYTIGFMGFVMSLKKGYLKQQFGLFCWVHMSLLLIVVSSHFIVNNILEGLIWFWVPASLVICNDVFAYIWGITLGRTPLIKLSPKKTVEGFVGAFWSTIIFGVFWGTYFMRFNYMICPVHDLGVSAFSSTQCMPNPVFVWKDWEIWSPVAAFLSTLFGRTIRTIPYAPYQYHLLLLSFFASLVAPFGGFFASGFKRAFNIKDFGHSIPGHGGMTDRMDCQFLMGVFTYVYYSSLIREHRVTVGGVLQTIVSGLTLDQQLELIADLKRYLGTQGIKVP